jgi:hypothetical protein
MLLRHKVPTIFNIYMLDVICCALGCVILLWQVAHQEAEEQTAKAKDSQSEAGQQADAAVRARRQYEKAKVDLLSASNDVSHLQAALADWQQKYLNLTQALAMTEKEREEARKLAALRQTSIDKTSSALTLTKEQLKKLEVDLAKLLADNKKTNAELTGKQKINLQLLAKIALSAKQLASLKEDITLKQATIDDASKKGEDQLALLKLSDQNARKLQKLLDSLRDDNKNAKTKIKLTELQLKMREQDLDKSRKDLLDILTTKDRSAKDLALSAKDLSEARSLMAILMKERDLWKDKGLASKAVLGSLRLEKDKLNQRILDLQAEVDQRFAGIPLTGENVVFLIDVSGSMTLMDENTDDPEKWPFLCETLMKLMKSIPTLQRFQVILFSDKTSYLFSGRDSWFKYEGPQSAKMTRDALRKVKVEGGTNMHDGLEEAFRYRKIQLDTIYLFSDGLPNLGAGVPASVNNPTETQKNFYMSKFIRDRLKSEWNRPAAGQKNVRINAVGFFFESPDVGAFLWAMAREHKGSFVGLR